MAFTIKALTEWCPLWRIYEKFIIFKANVGSVFIRPAI
jgi:hypothetical protein